MRRDVITNSEEGGGTHLHEGGGVTSTVGTVVALERFRFEFYNRHLSLAQPHLIG